MEELIREFLIEGFAAIDELREQLARLDQNPEDAEPLNYMFRHVHTIKGICSFFNFTRLELVTHEGETLLNRLRRRELAYTPEVGITVRELLDAMQEMLELVQETGSDGKQDYRELFKKLSKFSKNELPEPDFASETCTEQIEDNFADELLKLIDDLQIIKDKILRLTGSINDPYLANTIQKLSSATRDLKQTLTKVK